MVAAKSGSHRADFSYDSPAKPEPMLPVLFAETVRNAWLEGPEGVGCEPADADTLTGPDVIICDLLQPAKATDAENAANPLNNWRRERSYEGVEFCMAPI